MEEAGASQRLFSLQLWCEIGAPNLNIWFPIEGSGLAGSKSPDLHLRRSRTRRGGQHRRDAVAAVNRGLHSVAYSHVDTASAWDFRAFVDGVSLPLCRKH